MIYSGESYTYNCNYNSLQEAYYAEKAHEIFSKMNIHSYTRASLYRLAVSYHNNDEYENALSVYNSVIDESTDVDFFLIQSLLGKAHTMIEIENSNYFVIDSLFRNAHNYYYAEFEDEDYWAWAYSLYRINKSTEADEIIGNLAATKEHIANFWKMRISEYLKTRTIGIIGVVGEAHTENYINGDLDWEDTSMNKINSRSIKNIKCQELYEKISF